jgi:Zn-finger protein
MDKFGRAVSKVEQEQVYRDIAASGSVLDAVAEEVERAAQMYPWWPVNIVEQAAIAAEESGEVVKSVNNYYWKHGDDSVEDIRKEAVQAAAMWVRFIVNLDEDAKRTIFDGTQPR